MNSSILKSDEPEALGEDLCDITFGAESVDCEYPLEQVTDVCQTVIVPSDYPATYLRESHLKEFEVALFDEVDKLKVEDGISPKFVGMTLRAGGILLTCRNGHTKSWVVKVVKDMELDSGILLRPAGSKILFKTIEYEGYFKGPILPPAQILKKIEIQNYALKGCINYWSVKKTEETPKGFFSSFRIPDNHIEFLEAINFTLFYHFNSVKLRLVDKKNTGPPLIEEGKTRTFPPPLSWDWNYSGP